MSEPNSGKNTSHGPRKLGLMISAHPLRANFTHGLKLAEAALHAGIQVYLYCLDEAVEGVSDPRLQAMREQGMRLFACAYGARARGISAGEQAIFAGLGTLSDIIALTDRFVSFN